MTIGKTIALTRGTFVGKVMSLLFNMLSRSVITFLSRSKRLLISWLQSNSNFGAQENEVCHCFHCFPSILPWSNGTVDTAAKTIWRKVGLLHRNAQNWCLSHKQSTLYASEGHWIEWTQDLSGAKTNNMLLPVATELPKDQTAHASRGLVLSPPEIPQVYLHPLF